MVFRLWCIVSVLLLQVVFPQASGAASAESIHRELVASVAGVHAGEEFLIAVRGRMAPGSYMPWKAAGEPGSPRVSLVLPEKATAAAFQWPIPEYGDKPGGVTLFYTGEVTPLALVRVPKDLASGSLFRVKATVDWLVCQKLCLPERADLELVLPVMPAATANEHSDPAIERARLRLPSPVSWAARVDEADGQWFLHINVPGAALGAVGGAWFYSDQGGRWTGTLARHEPNALIFRLEGKGSLQKGQSLDGVLAVKESISGRTGWRGFQITAAGVHGSSGVALGAALFFALLGGLILNGMPCVFPVLSLKVMTLLRQGEHSPVHARFHGLAYAAGVISSFALLGGVLILLKLGGAHAGWGFQFQSPYFVLAMIYLTFLLGLSLWGVFGFGYSVMGLGSGLADKPGYLGSFFTGVLATVVATPCTGPFMGVALGYALVQPAGILLLVLLTMGLGLSLPFLVFSHIPSLRRVLPRPGLWMERVKRYSALPMWLTSLWLLSVLSVQAGRSAMLLAVLGLLLIFGAALLLGRARQIGRWPGPVLGLLVLAGLIGGVGIGYGAPPQEARNGALTYTQARLQSLLARGEPVFLNATASWCMTCLANERLALGTEEVGGLFAKRGVHYLKAEWTSEDEAVSDLLARFGRGSVPLYVFFPRGGGSQPVLLPQILTPEVISRVVEGS